MNRDQAEKLAKVCVEIAKKILGTGSSSDPNIGPLSGAMFQTFAEHKDLWEKLIEDK